MHMRGKVLSVIKNSKGVYGFIKTGDGNYYYDTSSLQKGTFLKVGAKVEFDVIPWKGGRTKAVNIKLEKIDIEYFVLEEDIRETVLRLIVSFMGKDSYLDASVISGLLLDKGIDYKKYASSLSDFFCKYYKKEFAIKKKYTINDRTYPAVLVSNLNNAKVLDEETVIALKENFLNEISVNGFIQAAKVPNLLRNLGILQYKEYAATIDEFIEYYMPNMFVPKKTVFINGKRYTKVYVLIESADKFTEFDEKKSELPKSEPILFDETLKEKVKNGLRNIISSESFILGSEMPKVLDSFGIDDYKKFANSIEEFISNYYGNTFEMKKNVVINDKNCSSIIVLKSDNYEEETLGQKEEEIQEILLSMKNMLLKGTYEDILRHEAILKYGPRDFGAEGIEILLKAIGGYLGEDINHISLNQYQRLLVETETIADLKQFKDNDVLMRLGAESAIEPMSLEEYKRVFADIHNGKKNLNLYWNAIIERFWTAQNEIAVYATCLWLIITKHEKCIDLYIEEASKYSRIDQLIYLLKINQSFGHVNVTERLQRKIIGRCLDLNDINTLTCAIGYFGETMIPECQTLVEFLKESICPNDIAIMSWYHSGIGEQISEKITNYYWWKYSRTGIDQTLFRVLASVYWEYPENYYTEIIYNPTCPLFGRKEKELILRNAFIQICEQTKRYKKAFPWVNYLYLSLLKEGISEENEKAWQELHALMQNEVMEHFSEDINCAGAIALFRLDPDTRIKLENLYCEEYVADIVEEFSDTDELDNFVENCEKLGLQFITQWVIKHSDTNNVTNWETYVLSLCSSRNFVDAIAYVQKSNLSTDKKLSLLRLVLCENFKAFNVSEDAFHIFEASIPINDAEAALRNGLAFTDHNAISALIALYYYKKEWLKVAYLLAPFRAFYLDAHRKLIEDTRILAYKNYNVELAKMWSNHYEVVKRALRIYDSSEFDDFIEWARDIMKIPMGSNKYNLKPRTFDTIIQSMITSGNKDECWEKLVKMALRTDNNDHQDNLRFSIIASFIGRYGIDSIERIMIGLVKHPNATKGFADFYISLWKGLLNGKYSVNFLRLTQSMIGKAPITFWNLFYDTAVCKNHIFSNDDFELNSIRKDKQDYQGFYTTCLDCYCETREIVYLKIAAALLRGCSVDLEPEFGKYISFEASGRNKSFILSTFAILLEQNRYKEEIQAVVNSEYWNCSSVENEILKMLAWCCSDDLNDDSITEIETTQFKRDYLRCIKNYPEIDVEYALNRTDAIYRSKMIKEMLKIQYSPIYRSEAENAPQVVNDWRNDTKLKDYLELVSLLYQKQLNRDENMYNDAVFVKNRYVRIFTAEFLLEGNASNSSEDQIVSMMSHNKHLNSVYSDYEAIKKSIIEFWNIDTETEFHKVIFLVGLLSNNWEQFICNANDYDLRALELISNIEDQTNYRDFNIQIIDRFINDEYKVEDFSSFSICASKAYSILQELQAIKIKSEEEFLDVKKLINGICRLNHQGQAQRSYIYLKHALQTYPMELKKHWELFMLALSATSYKKTIIINLLSDVKKRKIEIEEIKLWLPVFHFYDDLAVYYYLLAARYALERKKEEATEAFSYILDKNALPREWGEDVKNLDSYLLGKLHYFSMVNNSTLQTLAIEKDVEAVSFVNMFLSKDEIGISKAVSAYKAILNAETENLVKLSSYKQLFSFVKKPDDLFDVYRQVESKVPNGNKSRLSYNELLIEYGCLLICIEDGISMDTRMQILLEVFDVFEFLNEINKSKLLILERMSEAEQSVLEKPGVAFDRWVDNKDKIISILRHPAINCSEDIIKRFCIPLEECLNIVNKCTSEMQVLTELVSWRDRWNMQQNCSDYEYAFVRSVDEKIKNLKAGANLSVSVVNKTIEDFSVFFCVENKAEGSNSTVSFNNSSEASSASLDVLVAINEGALVSYEGAKFVNTVELRPGDVCGQYYRLHNSLITNIKAGDLLTIVLRVIVGNKIICDSKVKYVYKEVGNMLVLKDRLYSRITKYETNVPAFSKTIKGYGRELEKQLIQQYLEQQLVVIYGPSRVGKSSLVNYISNEYIEEYSKNENKGIVAISIADDRHGNDYNVNMIYDDENVSFENAYELLRYLFISPLRIAFGSDITLKLKSRMRCSIAGEKLNENARKEIEKIISAEGSVRDILAGVSLILEENNCQVWYLFDEFQQIVEKWRGDTVEFTNICNDIMNYQNSIKLVLCGSDALVRLYNCENDEKWRGFIQKTADNNVPIGQLSPKDFKAMMEDASIWGDISENNSPWSPEALNLLYQYTGGNAICGKLFGNELLNKIMRGDFNRREKLYPSDITQVAYELLNSEVGLVRNLLVLHNTKNLEEEIPYLIFIAHELIHDRNKSDVSIRRIREFFAVKSPSAIESALKVLIARGILKVNEEKQRYGFSTMFYFDFFRSQATEVRLHEVSIQLQAERKQDNEEMSMDPMSLQHIRQYFKEAAPEVQNEFLAGLAINAKDKEALKSLLGTSQSGNIFNGKTTINHVNIQSITNTLNEIITANDRTVLIKGIQELPRLSNYLPQLLDNTGEVDVSEDSISRAMDNYVADMEESLESITLQSPRAGGDFAEATINSGYNTSISSPYATVLGVSDDEYEEFMEQYNLPEFFLRSLGFAYQLDELFMRGAVGDDIDKIDFSPVTIMYCKLIESLLKEYHISIYGNSFESLDTDMRKPENKDEKYKWKDIITLPVTQQQRLTIGSFVFPLYKKWAIDKLVKVTGKKTDEWVEHKKMIMAVKDIRNPSAHGNKDHRISLEQKNAITEMLLEKHGFMRLIELALG